MFLKGVTLFESLNSCVRGKRTFVREPHIKLVVMKATQKIAKQPTAIVTAIMKLHCTLLALSALYLNAWEATAFAPKAPAARPSLSLNAAPTDIQLRKTMDSLTPVIVQGGALRTWSFPTDNLERVLVCLETGGRHLNANVEVCQGPDNTPQIMDITVGKGALRPVKLVVETPGGDSSIFIRNTGPLEYPLVACVGAELSGAGPDSLGGVIKRLDDMNPGRLVQGGAVYSVPLDADVQSAQVLLKTDGRPLNARIELIQGPNSNKEVIELYTEDGLIRPLFTVIETPKEGNMIRIVNTATVEFPLIASVEPLVVEAIPPGPPTVAVKTTGGRGERMGPVDPSVWK